MCSLPLSTEGSCPSARRGGTYSELAATKDAAKIPEGPAARSLETRSASPYTHSPAQSCTPAGTSGVGAKARIPKGRKGSEVRICPPAPKSQSRKLRPCFRERTGPRSPCARPQSEPRLAARPLQGVSGEAQGPALEHGRNEFRNRTPAKQTDPLCPPLPRETRPPGAPILRSQPLAALAPSAGRGSAPGGSGSHLERTGGGGYHERTEA